VAGLHIQDDRIFIGGAGLVKVDRRRKTVGGHDHRGRRVLSGTWPLPGRLSIT
jgi:hypothetical protein